MRSDEIIITVYLLSCKAWVSAFNSGGLGSIRWIVKSRQNVNVDFFSNYRQETGKPDTKDFVFQMWEKDLYVSNGDLARAQMCYIKRIKWACINWAKWTNFKRIRAWEIECLGWTRLWSEAWELKCLGRNLFCRLEKAAELFRVSLITTSAWYCHMFCFCSLLKSRGKGENETSFSQPAMSLRYFRSLPVWVVWKHMCFLWIL